MQSVRVQLGDRSYDIVVTSSDPHPSPHIFGGGLGPFARQRAKGREAFLITDEHVIGHANKVAAALDHSGLKALLVSLPAGEGQKALATASNLYDQLAEMRADRQTLVVAIGGGVIGDLAGFVAATWNRGLPLLMVPTTLLAMVDSSVGGKVGINHPRGKNLIGAFHQPIGVWIDTSFLSTLPDREYRSGLAEVVKYGVILDAEFFAYLEQHTTKILEREAACIRSIVARCCRLKADVVERDEREERGLRAVLNYGHTFAHAFETVGGYGAWLHGEAVAAGMICASRLAERRGLVSAEVTERQRRLLQTFGLPIAPERWPVDELLETMRRDKKAVAGQLRFILPRRIGEVALFEDVPEEDVQAVLT